MLSLFPVSVLLCLSGMPQSQTFTPVPPHMGPGAPQLKPMYVDQSLFKPDKWWTYEGADDDRPDQFSVEQVGTVSLGGPAQPNVGARVQYLVSAYATSAAAHDAYRALQRLQAGAANVSRRTNPAHEGDECADVEETVLGDAGASYYAHRITARYGRYLVMLEGNSNLRALTPKPARGERPWLCEAAFASLSRAVQLRWRNYRRLLADADKPTPPTRRAISAADR